jgi:beta-lactamase regulating signal transducer with metallopeptidase domain
MAYCLIEGSILAAFVWLLLRLLPKQNAGTRFALWFSALLGTIVLPFVRGPWKVRGAQALGMAGAHGLITLPDSIALYIFVAWAVVAGLALMRVVLGLWQVQRLRRASDEIDPATLHRRVRQVIEEFSGPLSLRVSDRVRVPTAIGFFAPTVIVPNWFLEEMPAEELRHVLLHELAHLRRRDDWTNLLQKIIKAVIFFHPSAWWMEQQLSLEREIACDDAVLAQAATPHEYAECLKHVAEKSFLRRKLALAQAIVTRMRQLSLRTARILDVNRPGTTRLWKPAVPIIAAVAVVCGFSAATAPELVTFSNGKPQASVAVASANSLPAQPQEVKAEFRSSSPQPKMILAAASAQEAVPAKSHSPVRKASVKHAAIPIQARTYPKDDYVVQSEQVFVTMTSDHVSKTGQPIWQVHMWQVRVLVPANNHPDKNISRKNI